MYCYYVYILTNSRKTVLYIGVTNDIYRRLSEHREGKGSWRSFTGRYSCYHLIYYEEFNCIDLAIAREKELKKWSRQKKENLISINNPKWDFLNSNFL